MTPSRLILSLTLTGLVSVCSTFFSYGHGYTHNFPGDADIAPPHARQAIYTELGGAGLVLSLNYDTRLTKKEGGLGMRGGIGYSFRPIPRF